MHHVRSASQQSPRPDSFSFGFLIGLIGGLGQEDEEASHEYGGGSRGAHRQVGPPPGITLTIFTYLSLQRRPPPRSLCKQSKPHFSLYLIVRGLLLEPRMRMPVVPAWHLRLILGSLSCQCDNLRLFLPLEGQIQCSLLGSECH